MQPHNGNYNHDNDYNYQILTLQNYVHIPPNVSMIAQTFNIKVLG